MRQSLKRRDDYNKLMKAIYPGSWLLCPLMVVSSLIAAEPPTWVWRSQPVTGNSLRSVAASDEAMVAVGHLGTMLRGSKSGLWTSVTAELPTTSEFGSFWLQRIHHHDGLFVATGDSAALTESEDGWNWTTTLVPGMGSLRDVSIEGPRMVALGIRYDEPTGATVTEVAARQDDGTWTRHTADALQGAPNLAFGQGKWLALGNSPGGAVSTDGTNWINAGMSWSPRFYYLSQRLVGFANDTWVMACKGGYSGLGGVPEHGLEIMTSTDGLGWRGVTVLWPEFPDPPSSSTTWSDFVPTSIRYVNERWFVVGDSALVVGGESGPWIRHTFDAGQINGLLDITYFEGAYYLVGSRGRILRSPDLEHWTDLNPPAPVAGADETIGPPFFLQDLQFGDGTWVGLAALGVAVQSRDGVNWQVADMIPGEFSAFTSLSFDAGEWLAFGGTRMARSVDGLQWTVTTNDAIGSGFSKVVSGNGRWVAVAAGGHLYHSSDLETWTLATQPASSLKLKFGGGMFVNPGSYGAPSLQSADGQSWSPLDDPGKVPFDYAGGYWFASDAEGGFFRSTGLKDWEEIVWPWPYPPAQVVFGNGRWLGMGGGTFSFADLAFSEDGLSWSRVMAPCGTSGDAFASFGNDRFLIVRIGQDWFDVVESLPNVGTSDHHLGLPTRIGVSAMQLSLRGIGGDTLLLEQAVDLGNTESWQLVERIPVAATPRSLSIPWSNEAGAMLFRARPEGE